MSPSVRCHRTVAREVLPLLEAHAHVGARVLLTGCTRSWEKLGAGRRNATEERHSQSTLGPTHFWAFSYVELMQKIMHLIQHVGVEEQTRSKQCHHKKPDLEHSILIVEYHH